MVKWIIEKRTTVLILLIIAAIIFFLPRLKYLSVDSILNYASSSPWVALLIILGLYCIKSMVMVIPVAVLYISAGLIFSPILAILISYTGLFLEITLGYFIGKTLGQEKVEELVKKNKKAENFLNFNMKNNASTCFIVRLSPLPIELGSLFFGASGTPWGSFILFSLLGLTATMIPRILVGRAITNSSYKGLIISFVISLTVSIIAFIFMMYIQKKQKRGKRHE